MPLLSLSCRILTVSRAARAVSCSVIALSVSACATTVAQTPQQSQAQSQAQTQVSQRLEAAPNRRGWDGTIKIGRPYTVAGITYAPRDDVMYAEEGIASWYGSDFHGKPTANGETFDMNEVSAAHKTLPMPSYVEVTNLENGRSLVVRVNDRGPFKPGRIIDLSRRAAQLLGFDSKGVARVRVQRVFPENAPEVLLAGRPGLPMPEAPRSMVPGAIPTAEIVVAQLPPTLPARALETAPTPPAGERVLPNGYFVQVAAVGDQDRAQVLSADLRRFGQVSVEAYNSTVGQLFRVRVGPYLSRDAAETILAQVKAAGYADARVLTPAVS
jgi:rare lipoprotein A